MKHDELKLVFDALKDCTTYAVAGGFGKRATAHRDALDILEKALAQEEALQALHAENERLGLYKDAYAQPEQNIAALVEGMEVSIDVSTGEHDSGNRLFGVVTLVQENQGSKHGLILLVQEPKANFKEALAQPTSAEYAMGYSEGFNDGCKTEPEQEPSGHFLDFAYSDSIAYVHVYDQFRKGQQFYKAPPQRTWVGLTDDEMEATFIECGGKWNGDFWKIEDADFHPFLRTIEAKLKDKNCVG